MALKHALTIDLPDPVYRNAKRLADDLGLSLAALAREAIVERTRRPAPQIDLAAAYETLAEDAEEADVEGFVAAQAEAIAE